MYVYPEKTKKYKWSNVFHVVVSIVMACFMLLSPFFNQRAAVSVLAQEDQTLNLYLTSREHLNPLNTFDLTGEAVMKLCYSGLFRIDDNERLRYDLLEYAEWSSDHLRLTLRLREGLLFSNQTPLTADDVALSILYRRYYLQKSHGREDLKSPLEFFTPAGTELLAIPGEEPTVEPTEIAPEEESEIADLSGFPLSQQAEYFDSLDSDPDGLAGLEAISSIVAQDDLTLEIYLSERSVRLPWVLNFAVIPVEYMEADGIQAIPGYGRYQIEQIKDDLSLVLTSVWNADLPPISVHSLLDENTALEWFANGKLDVLLLDENSFYERALRQDLFFIRQETLKYRYFIAGSNPTYAFANDEIRQTFRAWVNTWPADSPIRANQLLPLHSRDWRVNYLQLPALGTDDSTPLDRFMQLVEGRTLYLAAPATSYSRMVMDRLAERLSPLQCELNITFVPEEEYENFAANGAYDLLLGEYEMSYPLDPTVFRNALQKLAPAVTFQLPSITDERFVPPLFFYQFEMREEDAMHERTWSTVQEEADSFALSSVFPGGFTEQGIILGHRVAGSMSSPSWDPYRGIEGLRCLE